jgi:hypothetical protein
VGREAADHGTTATFDGFRKKLFGETGWDNKDRFVVMDTGRTVGYCIILNSNMTEITKKVKEYLTGQRLQKISLTDRSGTRCAAEIRDMAHT